MAFDTTGAFDRPLVIGHRGAAGLLPENTLPGFQLAVDLGVAAVELDVYLCEGALVVIHDDTLERTTSGTGRVAEVPLSTLRTLDAGQGAQIPLLEEVLDLVPAGIGINIELKGPATSRPLADLLLESRESDLLVSSFDHILLEDFHRRCPQVTAAPLFGRWRDDAVEVAQRFGGPFINLSRRLVNERRMQQIRAADLRALAYTVNEMEEAKKLWDLGVSGFFTDYPDQISVENICRAD